MSSHRLPKLQKQISVSEEGNTASITEQLPNIGQLMTKLGRQPGILLQEGIYDRFVRCVLTLIPRNPNTQLEQRASHWGQALIRKTSNYFNQPNPNSRVGEVLGYGISDYHECAIEQLTRSICCKLDMLSKKPRDSQSVSIVLDISHQMVPLVRIPSCQSVVEKFLWYSSSTNQAVLSEEFLRQLLDVQAKTFNEPRDGTTSYFPASTCVALWSSYLPALEHTIMNFVGTLSKRPHIGYRKAAQLLTSSHLPQACHEHPSISCAVDQVLRKLLFATEGSAVVLKAINIFQRCYLQQVKRNPKQGQSNDPLIPTELKSLEMLLQVLPSDLDSISKLADHLKYLISFTSQHQASSATVTSRVDLWLLVVKYQHWYHQCLVQAFRSEEPDLSKSCRWFIEWFHSPISDSHDLKLVDLCIQCIQNDNFPTQTSPVFLSVYHHLLMGYTVTALNNGLSDVNKITRLLPMNPSIADQLVFILDLLEVFDIVLDSSGRTVLLSYLANMKNDPSCQNHRDWNDIKYRLDLCLQSLENG
ncbi:putative Fanconi anemia group C protein-like [Apostichopus japonicus]|uniref:Putative Fanconi anemia group C protein-like n=1 Tax=Stichopus japonicus TaxID=307972 RepID=A0A2G8K6C1_STIJA|nr:putative Fanconi anemia group C protein-like [Apostichopus japonicus]